MPKKLSVKKSTSKKTTTTKTAKINDKTLIVQSEKEQKQFRVAIFGSARTLPNDKLYKQIFDLAKSIGTEGLDLVTGGGPGLMEAANAGHEAGDVEKKAVSLGFTIQLPFEASGNKYIEDHRHFLRFSKRLDSFMDVSDIVVITPGGIGTCLELFYFWQHTQVHHIDRIPLILLGDMWKHLVDWIKKYPLKQGLISRDDLDNIFVVKNNEEAMKLIKKAHKMFIKIKQNNEGKKKH